MPWYLLLINYALRIISRKSLDQLFKSRGLSLCPKPITFSVAVLFCLTPKWVSTTNRLHRFFKKVLGMLSPHNKRWGDNCPGDNCPRRQLPRLQVPWRQLPQRDNCPRGSSAQANNCPSRKTAQVEQLPRQTAALVVQLPQCDVQC